MLENPGPGQEAEKSGRYSRRQRHDHDDPQQPRVPRVIAEVGSTGREHTVRGEVELQAEISEQEPDESHICVANDLDHAERLDSPSSALPPSAARLAGDCI